YEEVFIACQVSFAFALRRCVTYLRRLLQVSPGLSSCPSSYRNVRINPDLSVAAKPVTISPFLQRLQPASA
ncbi:hypothetical protein OCO52_26970, partial [Achromobacter mucicolens]|uniref:hypothetical protein n=1 Tax=Achromobacter mucicolens TaxID=1389922 RepID=UPI0021D2C711